MLNRNQCYTALGALWIASMFAAPVASIAATSAAVGTAVYNSDSEILSERRCKRGPKQEICDWVKPDHRATTGH